MSSINPNINSNNDLERIAAILAPESVYNEELEEFDIPVVSYDSLKVFEEFLKGKVNSGSILTGRESLGYFSWEERFEFQGKVGSKEYLDIKKEKASCRDVFIFLDISEVNEELGIIVKVKRKEDNKAFYIPLEDLEGLKSKKRNQALDDYATWFINYQ